MKVGTPLLRQQLAMPSEHEQGVHRKRKRSSIHCLASGPNRKPTTPHSPLLILAINPPVTVPNYHLIVPSLQSSASFAHRPFTLGGAAWPESATHACCSSLHSRLEVWPSTCPHALLQPCATLPDLSPRCQRWPSATNTLNACPSPLTPSSFPIPFGHWTFLSSHPSILLLFMRGAVLPASDLLVALDLKFSSAFERIYRRDLVQAHTAISPGHHHWRYRAMGSCYTR